MNKNKIKKTLTFAIWTWNFVGAEVLLNSLINHDEKVIPEPEVQAEPKGFDGESVEEGKIKLKIQNFTLKSIMIYQSRFLSTRWMEISWRLLRFWLSVYGKVDKSWWKYQSFCPREIRCYCKDTKSNPKFLLIKFFFRLSKRLDRHWFLFKSFYGNMDLPPSC